jgi:DNA-binding NtrC family response regulator
MSQNGVRILLVDDENEIRTTVQGLLSPESYIIEEASDGIEAINTLQQSFYDLVLLDVNMPKVGGMEVLSYIKENVPATMVIMLTGVRDIKTAVECMRNGAFYYLSKPFVADELLQTVKRALEHRRLILENQVMRSQLSRLSGGEEIIGQSEALKRVLGLAEQVAPTESTILIQGASGTGKELIANLIYKRSLRSEKPFIPLNCASIPDTLIESEMFGFEKGAFTDAHAQKQGLVELANRGTLFLDEIGDISTIFQPKLLRFIQTGEFRRIGGNTVLKADVRIISATNKDLREEVKLGKFREDLLYRLNVITIQIPPLKDRKSDVPLLVENFLKNRIRTRIRKTMSPEAMEVLVNYDWPGNARELENVVEGAAILSKGESILPHDLALPVNAFPQSTHHSTSSLIGSFLTMKEIELDHIKGVLKNTKWDKKRAAEILDISLKTLYSKIAQYNLKQE